MNTASEEQVPQGRPPHRLRNLARIFALLFAVAASSVLQSADPAAAPRKKSAIPITRETTKFLTPVDADGYLDFAAALDQRSRGTTTPADNALPGIWNAYGGYGSRELPPPQYFQAMGIAPPRPDGDFLVPEQDFLAAYDFALHEKIWDGFTAAEQRIWTAREFPVVFAWLERNNRALDRAVEAAKKPRFYRPIVRKADDDEFILALMPHELQTFRAMSKHLALRANYRLGEGRDTDAWNDLIAIRRLARLAASCPVLLDVLIAYSLDAGATAAERNFLETNRLDQTSLRRCLRELKELPPLPSQADAIDIGERAFMLDTLQEMSRGNYKMFNSLEGPLTDENRRTIAANDFAQTMRTANQWYDRVAAALRRPTAAERVADLERLRAECKKINEKFLARRKPDAAADGGDEDRRIDLLRDGELIDYLLSDSSLLTPLLYRSHDEREQELALAKIGLALAAYRAEHGRFPANLDDLRPHYFTSLPTDIFSAGPLRYRLDPDGYTLYSVGPNGNDDQGENNLRDADAEVRTDDLALRVKSPSD